jgi:hypothetical protein
MVSDPRAKIRECDEKADNAITAMVAAVIGAALVPAHVNWALTGSAMQGLGSGMRIDLNCQSREKENSCVGWAERAKSDVFFRVVGHCSAFAQPTLASTRKVKAH